MSEQNKSEENKSCLIDICKTLRFLIKNDSTYVQVKNENDEFIPVNIIANDFFYTNRENNETKSNENDESIDESSSIFPTSFLPNFNGNSIDEAHGNSLLDLVFKQQELIKQLGEKMVTLENKLNQIENTETNNEKFLKQLEKKIETKNDANETNEINEKMTGINERITNLNNSHYMILENFSDFKNVCKADNLDLQNKYNGMFSETCDSINSVKKSIDDILEFNKNVIITYS